MKFSPLEEFFGEPVQAESLPPTDDMFFRGKEASEIITSMVQTLCHEQFIPSPRLNDLGDLLWGLIGNKMVPTALGDVPMICFAAQRDAAIIMVPVDFVERVKTNPVYNFGGLVFTGSQARDYYNRRLKPPEDVLKRAYAFEAEMMLACRKIGTLQPNEYQQKVLNDYPKGLDSLDPALWYESKPFEKGPQSAYMPPPKDNAEMN
jgi:hypothetical protein